MRDFRDAKAMAKTLREAPTPNPATVGLLLSAAIDGWMGFESVLWLRNWLTHRNNRGGA